MKLQSRLEDKIQKQLNPSHWDIENESANHGARLGGESHFKVLIVSPNFEGKSRLQRQRDVHSLFAEELASGIHALSLRLLTPQEWQDSGAESFVSPNCQSKPVLPKVK
ncbi:MAG: BolA family transcriptional regulator [Bdellovibrionales bacterium]|nr:BolA family transcriptional regulator [Bdellovibrionales bacterium]